jgi:hypothetical protein
MDQKKIDAIVSDAREKIDEIREVLMGLARGRRYRADSLSPEMRAIASKPWVKRSDRNRYPNDYAMESLVRQLCDEAEFAERGWRADVGETRLFATMLKYVVAQTTPTLYIPYQVRTTFPIDSSIPAGAQTVAFRRLVDHGDLQKISPRGTDIREVDYDAEEDIYRLVSYAGAFSWNLDDLEAAAFAGVPLSTEGLGVLSRAAERNFDLISLQGEASMGIVGVYNDANPAVTVPTTGTWATATHDQIVVDIHDLIDAVRIASGTNTRPNRLVIPTSTWRYLRVRRANTDLNVLAAIQQDYPGLQIVENYRADLYDAAGTGPRVMAFTYDPAMIKVVEPRRFQLEPAEKQGFTYRIAGRQKLGGCMMQIPLTVGYMDGV